MKTRKLLALVLTLVIVVSALSISALADGDPTFRGGQITGKAGDTVTFPVYIDNNPGIAGYKLQIDFSEDAFDLVSQDEDDNMNTLVVKQGDFTDEGGLFSGTTKYGCTALWYSPIDVDTDGVAVNVTLKISKNAINGEHAIKVRVDPINTLNVDQELVEFKTVDGTLTVTGGKKGTIDNSKVGPSAEELKQIEAGTLSPAGKTVDEVKATQEQMAAEAAENAANQAQLIDEKDDNGRQAASSSSGGLNLTQILLIIAGAVVAIAAVLLVVLRAAAKKRNAAADELEETAVDAGADEDLSIDEVMGWDTTPNEDAIDLDDSEYDYDDDDDIDD